MKRIALICALVYLTVALAADFFAISFRLPHQKKELQQFFAIQERLIQISKQNESSQELRETVRELLDLNEARAFSTFFFTLTIWVSIGASFVAFGALIYHWKKEL